MITIELLYPLSLTLDSLSLFHRYYQGKCFDELKSIITPQNMKALESRGQLFYYGYNVHPNNHFNEASKRKWTSNSTLKKIDFKIARLFRLRKTANVSGISTLKLDLFGWLRAYLKTTPELRVKTLEILIRISHLKYLIKGFLSSLLIEQLNHGNVKSTKLISLM